ncbi:hypothetical protein COM97_29260 [Bacillus thuringiensis]|uniref:hypothetical protein n=1 Tax=Bacillus thuringiensis TaxID=1428 RepID=UPI000BEE417C|nr:hypothetical protein [Bacillus thuringiensis]PEF03079.1 hypothetical protein COM97_29260 [Bacillus thuringiensis]
MNSFEKITLYILSFLLYPIGIITWIISLFSNDFEKKKVGRICLYISLVSFVLFLILGIATFLMTATFNVDLNHSESIQYQINDIE